jgi:hypothetical protein
LYCDVVYVELHVDIILCTRSLSRGKTFLKNEFAYWVLCCIVSA